MHIQKHITSMHNACLNTRTHIIAHAHVRTHVHTHICSEFRLQCVIMCVRVFEHANMHACGVCLYVYVRVQACVSLCVCM